MAVTTIYANITDGYIESTHATVYANARDGTGTSTINSAQANHFVGQIQSGTQTWCYETFMSFDTSSIPDTDTISAVSFNIFMNADGTDNADFIVNCYAYNWGGTIESADWRTAAQLTAMTPVATLNSSGIGAQGYKLFTDVSLPATINKTGTTYFLLASNRHAAGTTPVGNEYLWLLGGNTAGTGNDPYLSITHAAASGGNPITMVV